MKLENKAVVVTGASSGIGKAIAELFVKEGASVIAVARRRERLEALAKSLENEPGRILVYTGDVSKREVCEGMIDECITQFGKLDVLVNNAGVVDNLAAAGNFIDEQYDYVMSVNVYGPLAAMRKAVNVFLAQGSGGNIITVTSFGAKHQATGVAYSASKAAVNAAVRHTAFVYRKDNIRSNAIAPGGIKTEIGTTMTELDMDGIERIKGIQALMPGEGEAENIAAAALFLASDDSSFISGQIIGIDGGWSAM